MYIHKMPRGELPEVINYYENKTINEFKEYIGFTRSYSHEKIEFAVNILTNINKTLSPRLFITKGNNNILAIDSYYIFLTLKEEISKELKYRYSGKPKSLKNHLICLMLLDDFYKKRLR